MVLVHVGYLVLPVFGSVRNRGIYIYLSLTITYALFILISRKLLENLLGSIPTLASDCVVVLASWLPNSCSVLYKANGS